MRILPPNTRIADPFFDVVRRRHPEADIVLLPPADPSQAHPTKAARAADAAEALSAAELVEAAARTRALLDDLLNDCGITERITPRPRLRATGPDRVTATSNLTLRVGDAAARSAHLASVVVGRGWQAQLDEPRDSSLTSLRATKDGVRLQATASAAGVWRVEVVGPTLVATRSEVRAATALLRESAW